TLAGFKLAGLYRGSYRHAGLAEAARALRAVGVGGLFGLAAIAVLGVPVSLAGLVLHLYLMLTLVAGARFAFRVLEYVYQPGRLAELGAVCRAEGARLVHFDVRWDVAEARPPAEATS